MKNRIVRPNHCPRRGYSLLELVMGMAAAVVLMAGMASAVAVSSRSLSLGDTGAGARSVSTEVQRDFLADLERATGFTERTANAVTFTVPDRTGDGRPETLRYAWSGVAGAPLTLQMNGGSVQNLATNVQQFSLSFRTQAVTAPVVPDEQAVSFGKLLFVSGGYQKDPTFLQKLTGQPGDIVLTTGEADKIALYQGWGFEVSMITSDKGGSDFTTAFSGKDLVFVSSSPGTSSTASRYQGLKLGIVNENPELTASFGFCTGSGTTSGTEASIGGPPHYITQAYAVRQTVTLLSQSTTLQALPSTKSRDLSILGTNTNNGATTFGALAAGRMSATGTVITGRRVQLPWATPDFDSTRLTANGQVLLKASLLWAAGNGADGNPSLATIGPTNSSSQSGDFITMSSKMSASPVTFTTQVELQELAAYVQSNSKPLKLAVYSDEGGVPSQLLAQTSQLAGSGSTGWITGSIPALTLNAGTYWFAISLSDDTQRIYFAATTGVTSSEISSRPYANGFPGTWSNGTAGNPKLWQKTQLLIYGSYMPLQ